MIEQLIIALLFVVSLVYLTRSTWKSAFGKKKCASGCGSCTVIDFEAVGNKNV